MGKHNYQKINYKIYMKKTLELLQIDLKIKAINNTNENKS